MFLNHIPSKIPTTRWSELRTLVENRSVYSLTDYELNIFETHQESEKVKLNFSSMVITTMLQGKKVMHLPDKKPFVYLPGESVLVAPNEEMTIDFPEAQRGNPTQCIALAVGQDKIRQTIDMLNETFPKEDKQNQWFLDDSNFHLKNSQFITSSIDRLVSISREDVQMKDILADLALRELILRLLQTQAANLIFGQYHLFSSSNRMAFVVSYIQENLGTALSIKTLSEKACMSESSFFRAFKQEFGMTPVEYILQQRISLARKLLAQPGTSISDVCFRSGFNNLNHFCNLFKRYSGVSPGSYRKEISGGFV
jgi:AraC-like DNA-binding protein